MRAVKLKKASQSEQPLPKTNAEHSPLIDNMLPKLSLASLKKVATNFLLALGAASIIFLIQLTLISQVQYESAQLRAFETIRFELANGTAPVGQVDSSGQLLAEGTAVAVLEIEKIGVQDVVLSGTSAAVTIDGPGHRRDTVLPGQAGISVIYGRQASYGGVFSRLAELELGDKIRTTTGQGEASYTVSNIRYAGDPVTNDLGDAAGRLTLVTATGLPYFAQEVLRVEATLDGQAYPTPMSVIPPRAIPAAEATLAGNFGAVTPLAFLSQFFILFIFAVRWLVKRWGPIQAWLAATPVIVFGGSLWAGLLIQLLPNLT